MIILKSNIGVGIVVAIFVTLVIPGIFYLYNFLREKTGFLSSKYSELLKLKNKLSDIERQISSFKQINDTGRITREEKDEWLQLTKTHKIINDKIISIKNKSTSVNIQYDSNPVDNYLGNKIDQLKESNIETLNSHKENERSFIQISKDNLWFNKKCKKYKLNLDANEKLNIQKIFTRDINKFLISEVGWFILTNKRIHFFNQVNEININKTDIISVSKNWGWTFSSGPGIKILTKEGYELKLITGLWGRENLINQIKK